MSTVVGYEVTAHLVSVKVPPPVNVLYVYRGGVLPPDTKPESIEHLLGLGMIRPIDELETPR